MIDYHLHLHDHGESGPYTLEGVSGFAEIARERGVGELGFTEHLFRFHEATSMLGDWWRDEPNPALRDYCSKYFESHSTQSLEAYVAILESARAEGVNLAIGIEVDFYPGRMSEISALLDGYPLDFRLGSVHWLGGWGFDDPGTLDEWAARDIDQVWGAYFEMLVELAESGTIDVLAHPDLVKKFGHRPPAEPVHLYDHAIEAAAERELAFEVSSAGLRKPVGEAYPSPEFLGRMSARGIEITTASDAHSAADVGRDFDRLKPFVASAGYEYTNSYRDRRAVPVAIDEGPR